MPSGRDREETLVRPSETITSARLLRRALLPRRGYRHHKLLRDPAAHRNLAVHGYHVGASVIDRSVVDRLRDASERWLEANPPAGDGRFHSSYEANPSAAGLLARRQVADLLIPALTELVTADARLRASVLQCKPSSPASGLAPHQDGFLVDERSAYGLNAWTALTDITIDDGPLVVLPGSHRYGSWARVSTVTDDLEHLQTTIERHSRLLELRAGQVVWFDNATIHGSLINEGGAMRIAASAVAVPRSCPATVPVPVGDRPVDAQLYELDLDGVDVSDPLVVTDGRSLGRIGLAQLRFAPWALGLAARSHRLVHPGAQGRRLPPGVSCTPH